jgi:hypothetical protein
MLTTGGQKPKGMTAFADRVYDVLQIYTVSPWNILKVECGWRGMDPLMLEQPGFAALIPSLGAHVARMTDDENAEELMGQLWDLVR